MVSRFRDRGGGADVLALVLAKYTPRAAGPAFDGAMISVVAAPASAIRKLRGSRLRPEGLLRSSIQRSRRALLSLPKHLPWN